MDGKLNTNNMKQTAIEWIIEQFKDYDCTPASNNDEYVIVIPQWIFNAKRDEALEMERNQILDAFEEGSSDGYDGWGSSNKEKYYNEKYNK